MSITCSVPYIVHEEASWPKVNQGQVVIFSMPAVVQCCKAPGSKVRHEVDLAELQLVRSNQG